MRDLASFIMYVQGQCAYAGVKFRLEARKSTRAGGLGSYREDTRVLFVCGTNEDWPMVLAHELAHIDQEQERVYANTAEMGPEFDDWCAGKRRFAEPRVRSMVRALQKMELDAERRALQYARRFHLTDDVGKYIQAANRYVWKFEVARRLKTWPKYGDADATVLAAMPTKLITQAEIGKPPEILESLAQ